MLCFARPLLRHVRDPRERNKGKLFNLPAAGNRTLPARPRRRSYCPISFRFFEKSFEREGSIVRRSGRFVIYGRCFFESFAVAKNRGASGRKKWLARRKIWRTCGPFKGPIGARRGGRRSRRSKGALSVAPFLARYTLEGVVSLCPFYVSRSFSTCLSFSSSLSPSLFLSVCVALFQRFPRKKLRGSVRLRGWLFDENVNAKKRTCFVSTSFAF